MDRAESLFLERLELINRKSRSMQNLVIYGASYFDLIKLIDAINRNKPTWNLLGFLDDTAEKQGESYFGFPVLGGREVIPELVSRGCGFFNNVCGHWSRSKKISQLLENNHCDVVNLVHPGIDLNYVEMGKSIILPEGCLVGSGTVIGDFLSARLGVLISHDVVIEGHVFIGPGVTIGGGAILRKGSFIGAGATIMLGLEVGEKAVVGAGAVVTKDVAANTVVAGVPAKFLKTRARV
jgi:sugar O-acyltransferase (sialic acid O-acetyltransferase NeuD family)